MDNSNHIELEVYYKKFLTLMSGSANEVELQLLVQQFFNQLDRSYKQFDHIINDLSAEKVSHLNIIKSYQRADYEYNRLIAVNHSNELELTILNDSLAARTADIAKLRLNYYNNLLDIKELLVQHGLTEDILDRHWNLAERSGGKWQPNDQEGNTINKALLLQIINKNNQFFTLFERIVEKKLNEAQMNLEAISKKAAGIFVAISKTLYKYKKAKYVYDMIIDKKLSEEMQREIRLQHHFEQENIAAATSNHSSAHMSDTLSSASTDQHLNPFGLNLLPFLELKFDNPSAFSKLVQFQRSQQSLLLAAAQAAKNGAIEQFLNNLNKTETSDKSNGAEEEKKEKPAKSQYKLRNARCNSSSKLSFPSDLPASLASIHLRRNSATINPLNSHKQMFKNRRHSLVDATNLLNANTTLTHTINQTDQPKHQNSNNFTFSNGMSSCILPAASEQGRIAGSPQHSVELDKAVQCIDELQLTGGAAVESNDAEAANNVEEKSRTHPSFFHTTIAAESSTNRGMSFNNKPIHSKAQHTRGTAYSNTAAAWFGSAEQQFQATKQTAERGIQVGAPYSFKQQALQELKQLEKELQQFYKIKQSSSKAATQLQQAIQSNCVLIDSQSIHELDHDAIEQPSESSALALYYQQFIERQRAQRQQTTPKVPSKVAEKKSHQSQLQLFSLHPQSAELHANQHIPANLSGKASSVRGKAGAGATSSSASVFSRLTSQGNPALSSRRSLKRSQWLEQETVATESVLRDWQLLRTDSTDYLEPEKGTKVKTRSIV
jgi:hypothetical protein